MNQITVYIKTLFGDIIPITFEPKERNIHLMFKVQSFFKEYPVERILLYYNDFIDISNVKDGDILYLFICEPYTENWSSISFSNADYTTYIVNWYGLTDENYFYDMQKKTSIALYVDINSDKFRVSASKNNYLLEWFPDLREALLDFQKKYNNTTKHCFFSDDKLIHIYHLWNLNTSEFYKEMIKSRYYDY